MNEHSKEPQDQLGDEFHTRIKDVVKQHGCKSCICIHVDEHDQINYNVMFRTDALDYEVQSESVCSVADLIVEMIAGGLGEKIMMDIEDQCVSMGKEHLYQDLLSHFDRVSTGFIEQALADEDVPQDGDDPIVIPPDQTFIF